MTRDEMLARVVDALKDIGLALARERLATDGVTAAVAAVTETIDAPASAPAQEAAEPPVEPAPADPPKATRTKKAVTLGDAHKAVSDVASLDLQAARDLILSTGHAKLSEVPVDGLASLQKAAKAKLKELKAADDTAPDAAEGDADE